VRKPGSSSPQPEYLILWKNQHEHYDTTHTAPKNSTCRNIFLNQYQNAFHLMYWSFLYPFYFIFLTNLEHLPSSAIIPPLHLHDGTAGDSVFRYKEDISKLVHADKQT